ncbi:TonB-dependent receptor [Mucilaginibacter sp. Bleaf8]|uniref:TonB-dependent receptor n=1 Tax=Mucilaginibacter sp. Bleaf8 TaxID=2834430 RepID=UPI001BCBEA1A|nr:TonB-dependent receptor [Mucilaginibacter sp. Bleaf8]MBS7564847.1 TonB-dependent receptor [Mucilaginibacter sp. Bleaf8]
MKRYYLVLILFISLFSKAYSQHISGTVTDALTHEPLPGVTITGTDSTQSIKCTAITDRRGVFSIKPATTLKFAMVGYESKQIKVSNNNIYVALQPSSLDLQQVVVSASREGQAREDAPIAISKTGSVQIQDTKATAIYQLLNKVPGVNMVNLNSEQHMMQIRQPITTKALYLYLEDGLPIRPTGIFQHNALYEINMAGVKDIEVIKGPASSLYGSNAIGGAVNFITQGPPQGYSGYVALQGDNYHYRRADASGGFTAGKFGLFVGGYIADQKNGWQDYSDFRKRSITLNTTYDFNASTRLTTQASYNYLHTETPGSLDSIRFYNKSYSSNQEFAYREVKATRASTKLEHRWNERNFTFLTAFFRSNTTGQLPSYYLSDVRNSSGQYVSSNGQINELNLHSYGLLAQHRSDFSFLQSKLIVGAYVDNSPSKYFAKYLKIQKDLANNYYTGYTNTDSLIDNYKIKLFNTAVYAQYEFKPTDALRIVTGLRYDRVYYNFNNSLPPNRTKYKQQQKNSFNIVAPKVGLTYDLGNNNGFYGNFSVGFQPPETGDLYSSRQTRPVDQATFYNYEAGGWLTALNKRMRFELSVYDMEGRNEIISVLQADNTTQNENAGATRHRGIEYGLTYVPVNQLAFRFSGTNAWHTYVNFSTIQTVGGKSTTISYDGNRMVNAPVWIANSEITYKPSYLDGFRSSFEWQHIGPYYKDNANARRYDRYDVFNLRLGYDLHQTALKGIGVWFNVINLTNRLYATNVTSSTYSDTYYAAPPRTYTLGISYSFAKH